MDINFLFFVIVGFLCRGFLFHFIKGWTCIVISNLLKNMKNLQGKQGV